METFIEIVMPYIIELAAFVVIALLGIFGSWLLSKLKQKKGLENIAIATEQVLNASQKTVKELQQTLVEGWKRAQDGKLTSEQVAELKDKVLEITQAKLGEPTKNLLIAAKIDITTLITSEAEAFVLELKKGGV